MSQDHGSLLKAVPLFRDLGADEINTVIREATEVAHVDGHEITGEGNPGVGFHLILSGEASVTQDGRPLAVLRPGQFFGEMALLDGQPRSATVTAIGPVRTLSIVAWRFEPLLEKHPRIAISLLRELCARVRRAEGSVLQ